MSENRFTPGPWLQSWDCESPTGSDASQKYEGFEVVTSDGWPIAFVPIHFAFPPVRRQPAKRELDWDEASANLRLLCAAPKLYEALRDCIASLGGINSDATPESARLAIAQATGASHE